AAFRFVDGESGRTQAFELTEGNAALELRLVLVSIHELVHIADSHASLESARHGALRGTGRRNQAADREIARSPRRGCAPAGEIPAGHLLIEDHTHAIGKLRVQKWAQQRILRELPLHGSAQRIVEAELAAFLSVKQAER